MALFFGIQAMECYVIVGWAAQYLRDEGLSASAAGLLLAINLVIVPVNAVVPALTVRPRCSGRCSSFFLACYFIGWLGLWVSPLSVPWLWMGLLVGRHGHLRHGPHADRPAIPDGGDHGRAVDRRPRAGATSSPPPGRCWSASSAASPAATPGCSCWLTGVVVLTVTGWLVTRQRFVDDEVPVLPAGRRRATGRRHRGGRRRAAGDRQVTAGGGSPRG